MLHFNRFHSSCMPCCTCEPLLRSAPSHGGVSVKQKRALSLSFCIMWMLFNNQLAKPVLHHACAIHVYDMAMDTHYHMWELYVHCQPSPWHALTAKLRVANRAGRSSKRSVLCTFEILHPVWPTDYFIATGVETCFTILCCCDNTSY